MGPVRLDGAALGALEDDLSLLVAHPLDVVPGGVPPRHRPRVRQHRPRVRRQGQHGQRLEQDQVDHGVDRPTGALTQGAHTPNLES